jgi:hypothetical protein
MMQDAGHIDLCCTRAATVRPTFFDIKHPDDSVQSNLLAFGYINTLQSSGFGKGKAIMCDGGAVKSLTCAKIDAEIDDTFADIKGAARRCMNSADDADLIPRQNLRQLKRYKHLSKSEIEVSTVC